MGGGGAPELAPSCDHAPRRSCKGQMVSWGEAAHGTRQPALATVRGKPRVTEDAGPWGGRERRAVGNRGASAPGGSEPTPPREGLWNPPQPHAITVSPRPQARCARPTPQAVASRCPPHPQHPQANTSPRTRGASGDRVLKRVTAEVTFHSRAPRRPASPGEARGEPARGDCSRANWVDTRQEPGKSILAKEKGQNWLR